MYKVEQKDVIEGKTFNIDKLGDDCYLVGFHHPPWYIMLDEEEMRDITETFTKYVNIYHYYNGKYLFCGVLTTL